MVALKPKAQHEQLLAKADRDQIVLHQMAGSENEITIIAVTLARKCDLFVHFQRLWTMRVSDLDETLSSESYMRNIYNNRRTLYKELCGKAPR